MITKLPPITLLLLLLFSGATSFAQTLFTFIEQEKIGYKNTRGNIVIPAQYALAGDFSKQGLAIVFDNTGWAFINRKGQIVIRTPFLFDGGPDDFAEGLARFTVNEKLGFFDQRGNIIIAAQFDFAAPFRQGAAAVCLECRKSEADNNGHYNIVGGRWGCINRQGKVIVPLRYKAAEKCQIQTRARRKAKEQQSAAVAIKKRQT